MIENACAKVFVIGEEQYAQFVWNRFVLGKEDIIATTITRNNFKLPKDIKTVQAESPQIKIAPSVLTKLRNACENRRELTLKLFDTEFTGQYTYLIDNNSRLG